MDERIKRARATVAAGDRGERADAGVVEGAAAVGGLVFERGGDLAPSGWRDARAGSRRVHVLAAEYRLDGGVEVGLGDRPAALRRVLSPLKSRSSLPRYHRIYINAVVMGYCEGAAM